MDEPKPDFFGCIVRFIVGAAVGFVLGSLVTLSWFYNVRGSTVLSIGILISAVFGFCAAKWGDDFWDWLKEWLSWWPW
jgi:hypothetical protein